MIDGRLSDANNPNLSVGYPRQKLLACGEDVISDLIGLSIDVDRHDFAGVLGFEQCAERAFIDRLAALGGLFGTVSRCGHCGSVLCYALVTDDSPEIASVGSPFNPTANSAARMR